MGSRPLKRLDAVFISKLRVTLVLFVLTSVLVVFGTTKVRSEQSKPPMRNKALDFWVHSYLRWHEAHRHNASRVAILLPCTKSMGDQIQSIMNIWAFSVLTNRLVLLHNNQPYSHSTFISPLACERFVFNDYRDSNLDELCTHHIVHSDKGELSHYGAKQLLGDTPIVALQLSRMKHPSTMISTFTREKKIRPPPFSLEVQRVIARLFLDPSNDTVMTAVRSFSSRHGLCNRGQRYEKQLMTSSRQCVQHISVYARFEKRYGRRKIVEIATCFAGQVYKIAKRERNRSPTILVHTDSSRFREELERNMRVIIPQTKLHHREYGSKLDDQASIHVENILMSNAQHIVGFRSGFTRTAFLRGAAKSYTIIRPESCTL